MKKASLLLFLIIAAIVCPAQEAITYAEALQTARTFADSKAVHNKSSIVLGETVESTTAHRTNLFIFHIQPEGFIVVSALNEVLAYSFDNSFPSLNDAPEGVAMWIDCYNKNTDYRFEHPEIEPIKRPFDSPRTVEPLLTSRWTQECYYNDACPSDENGPCGHTMAGCVAIAMAQIMYYYKQPSSGAGNNQYSQSTYGVISADFENTYYQWDEMKDVLTEPNPATAELIFHCGVSVNMNYGASLSNASSSDVVNAFWLHFGYYCSSLTPKENYSDEEWINLLKTNLDHSYPIYYRGTKIGEGGHAFVCDGYDSESRFHFNFGWGGGGDGFYDINDPLGFCYYHQIIHSLFPIKDIPIQCDAHGIYYISPDGNGDGSSWSNATPYLQLALLKASSSDEQIWVREGVYNNTTTNSHCFLCPANCKVFGGFRGDEPYDFDLATRNPHEHPTILDGFSSQGVLKQLDSYEGSQLLIDGFIIRNGIADKGGGLNLIDNFLIRNCIIENCYAASYGGGLYLNGTSKNNQMENCIIRGNNALYGGGIYDNEKENRYINCQISNNEAVFQGGGAYVSPYGKKYFFNCLCNNNKAAIGGGFYMRGDVEIYNSTVVMNEASSNYGGFYNGSITHQNQIVNSIIWGNTSQGQNAQIGPLLGYQYCAVQDDETTIGHNIKLEAANDGDGPFNYVRFMEVADTAGINGHGGNWHLQNTSPCIDLGKDIIVAPTIDMEGNPRHRYNAVDFGIYESNHAANHIHRFLCDGGPFQYEGHVFNEEGYYTLLYHQPDHDSLLVINLTPKVSKYVIMEKAICEGQSVDFNGQILSDPGHYVWENDCVTYDIDLTTMTSPSLQVIGDTVIPAGATTRLTVTGAEQYVWSNGDTHATITVAPEHDTTYHVTGSIGLCQSDLFINVHVKQEEALVIPNPANDQVSINAASIKQVDVFTILGQRIASYQTNLLPLSISVSGYPSGIYLVLIRCNDKEHLVKLAVTH